MSKTSHERNISKISASYSIFWQNKWRQVEMIFLMPLNTSCRQKPGKHKGKVPTINYKETSVAIQVIQNHDGSLGLTILKVHRAEFAYGYYVQISTGTEVWNWRSIPNVLLKTFEHLHQHHHEVADRLLWMHLDLMEGITSNTWKFTWLQLLLRPTLNTYLFKLNLILVKLSWALCILQEKGCA